MDSDEGQRGKVWEEKAVNLFLVSASIYLGFDMATHAISDNLDNPMIFAIDMTLAVAWLGIAAMKLTRTEDDE